MPTMRDRLINLALGPEKRQLVSAMRNLTEFYLAGPFEPPTNPEALRSMLGEFDSALIQDLVNEIEWERMGGQGYDPFTGEQRRVRAVNESRRLWLYDVVTAFVVQLWTDFGFGENIKVMPADEKAAEIWAEFWAADRNDALLAQDHIQELSENLLVDGDVLLAYYISTVDGKVTVRPIDGLEITDVVTDPDDAKKVLFYKRRWTSGDKPMVALYPDWQPWLEWKRGGAGAADPYAKVASSTQVSGVARADQASETTAVVVQHMAYKRRGGLRGWPLMTAGAPWVREHRRFRENRASVAAAMAMYIQKIKSKGSSRGIEAIRAKLRSSLATTSGEALDTNPPAPAGSTWLENDAANLERLPMGTGAGDAKEDGGALLMMAGLGGGIYPHYLGAGESFRLATATAMESPMLHQFSRYKLFWSAQFRRMLKVVLEAAALYGQSKPTYETMEAEVSSDRLIEVDLQMVSDSVTALVDSSLTPYFENGQVDGQTAGKILAAIWQIVLQGLGVDDPEKIADDIGFGVEPEPEEAAVRESRRPFGPAAARQELRRRLAAQERGWRVRLRAGRVGRLLAEAGWDGMSEASSHQDDYGRGLRGAARGLWNGTWSRDEASDAFALTIEVGLRWAWVEGMAAVGIDQDAITAAEWDQQGAIVAGILQHLGDLLTFIADHSKTVGGTLATVLGRIGLWENEYNAMVNAAKLAASTNPKMKWRLGATENHCTDCAKYHGRVYRASTWQAWGAIPQSRGLECKGYNCDCKLDPTTDRITPGHPPAPTGG